MVVVGGIKTCGDEKAAKTSVVLLDSISSRIASVCDELEKLQVEMEELRVCTEDIKRFII